MKKGNALKIGALTLLLGMGLFSYSCKSKSDKEVNEIQMEEGISEEGNLESMDSAPLGANDIQLMDENENVFSTESLRGKVVFINFWATWCPPCIKEMPSINNLKKSFEDNHDIVFLLIDVDGKMEKSKAFMEKNNFDLPVSIPNGNIPPTLLGNAIPTTVILDKKGDIAWKLEGGYDYNNPEIKKALDELVAQN